MSTSSKSPEPKRPYRSRARDASARQTRDSILAAARALFAARGVDEVKLADIAAAAGVATSTIFAVFKSRDGILRALMQNALFGPHYETALSRLEGETGPLRLLAATAGVASAIYQGEARELGEIRRIAAASPALLAMEREFDDLRYERQQDRIEALFAAGLARDGLTREAARRILWALTSRDMFRMLVTEGGWPPDAYEAALRDLILAALVRPGARS